MVIVVNNYFEGILANAVLKCEGYVVTSDDEMRRGFARLYPFTTENISGYIEKFDLSNKSLLTVSSSGDQVINASLFNCKNQTVVDICPYTKYYFYLKKAAIMTFSYDEYFDFFCYNDYPKFCRDNKLVFDKKKYDKLKEILRLLDFESFLFWDELFNLYNPIEIRKGLFDSDEDRSTVLKGMNLYMKNEDYFNRVKKSIRDINPKFIIDDIFDVKIDDVYDNIFLSNIGKYHELNEFKLLIEKMSGNLSDNGKMLICYLYNTTIDTEYKKDWANIYNLKETYSLLGEYITSMESFCGVRGIIFEDEEYCKDSVLVHRKIR